MTTLRRQFAGALLALFMAAFAGAGLAAGLGPINPQSRIGQPFAADIDLINVGRDDFMALKVGLASAASYRAAGLTLDPVLNSLRLTLERRANGAPYIRAITTRRVTEPYLDVLVELSTPDGGIQRAYTVLLDLPDTAQTAVAAAPATTAAVPATKPDATPSAQTEARPQRARPPVPASTTTGPAPISSAPAAPPPPAARAPATTGASVTPAPPGEIAPGGKPSAKPSAQPGAPAAPPATTTPAPAEPATPPTTVPPAPVADAPSPSAPADPPSPPPVARKAPVPPPQKPPQKAAGGDSGNYTALIVSIVLALLGSCGIWWLLASRRRRDVTSNATSSIEPTAAALALASPDAGEVAPQRDATKAAAAMEPTVSSVTDMVDPVDEAKVYLEHGQDEPAEKLLREALNQQPGREDVQLLLLEILGKRGDKDGFNQLAGRLHKQTGGAGEHWKRVMAMGYALDPAHALYSPAADAVAEAPAPSNAGGIDFDLGLSATDQAGTATDINLETPAPGGNESTDILLDDGSARKDIDKTLVLQRTGLMPAESATATPLDIQFDLPPAETPTTATRITPDAKAETETAGLDFSMDLPTIKPPAAIAAPAAKEAPALAPAKSRIDPELLEALLHKIDLARAFREMGDKEAALEELQDVLRDGDDALKTEAQELIDLLNAPAGG